MKEQNIYNETTTFKDLSEVQQSAIRAFYASLDRVRVVIGGATDGSGFWVRLHRGNDLMNGERGWRETTPGEAYSKQEVFFISEEQARAIAEAITENLD